MAQKNETLGGLDALITQARRRLAKNPDYIALRALEKARAEIVGEPTAMVDDETGEVLQLVPTGEIHTKSPSQMDAVRIALTRAGTPLDIRTLVDRARALGATVGGSDPYVNLGSTLSRSDEFKSIRWHGERTWWFSGRSIPGAAKEAAE